MASDRIFYKDFRYPVTITGILMSILSGFLAGKGQYTFAFIFFVIASFFIIALFKGLSKIEKTVTLFFNSLKNNDTALQYPVNIKDKTLARLHENINAANQHFQAIRMQNAYNENYYRTLIKHSVTGLLVLNRDNQIQLINESACRYAGISPESTNFNQVKIKNPDFYEAICNLQQGKDLTYKQVIGNEYRLLTFRAIILKKDSEVLKLISVQDIRHEIESKELESYRKLISVLTHEIMNQVTPLTSVSESMQSLFNRNGNPVALSEVDDEMLATTRKGLLLIEEQSKGLINFINSYRKISKVPQPVLQSFSVDEWIEQLHIVYSEKMQLYGIRFEINRDNQGLVINADKNLLNQVMINLINNAIDAVSENSSDRLINIRISGWQQNRIRISVMNNGPDIPPDIQDKIFVPFFTTKSNGSGVGLSICQEIIKLHGGSLSLLSSNQGITTFLAEF